MKLAVFDVDGTLINKNDFVLPQSTIAALNRLHDNGVKLAVGSGRPPFAIDQRVIEQIPFDYFVCSNGAYVGDLKNEPIYKHTFQIEQVEKIVEHCRNEQIPVMFQCIDHLYCYCGFERIEKMVCDFFGESGYLIDYSTHACDPDNLPFTVVVLAEEEQYRRLSKQFSQFVYAQFAKGFYDINDCHDKASGVAHLCEKIGIGMSDVIAFGDDFNDEALIRAAQIGVVMGNGRKEMKEIADFVTKDVKEDGIAYALEYLELI